MKKTDKLTWTGLKFPISAHDIFIMRLNAIAKITAQTAVYIYRMKNNREKLMNTLKDQGAITDEEIKNSIVNVNSIALKDDNSSSEVKEYNDSTSKQEIMTYNDENDRDSDIADTEHESSMIECPKFYYKMTPKNELVASKDPFPGSSVSPLYCRNNVMHDNVVQ